MSLEAKRAQGCLVGLADSLLEKGWEPTDQMQRYCRWLHQGYRSSTGRCFDIGNTVSSALHRFEQSGDPMSGSTDPYSAGNGSLMRLAPIPLYFHADISLAEQRAAEMSCTTHAATSCVDACRYTTRLIIHLLNGLEKETALKLAAQTPELSSEIQDVINGSFRVKQPPEIKGTGYVVKSLETAYGINTIPATWRERLVLYQEMIEMGTQLTS